MFKIVRPVGSMTLECKSLSLTAEIDARALSDDFKVRKCRGKYAVVLAVARPPSAS